jgi:tetratricopeptide (TPR) repeat protein
MMGYNLPAVIGALVGHYKILDRLGAGGMGVVYRAEDVRLGRQVALKFLPPDLAADPDALERFRREARVASSLNHPNICTIHDVGEHEGQRFIVMELLDGRMLKDEIAHGAVAFDRVLQLGIEIADALEAAHLNGIVHRDVKPANIFLTRRGQAKVLDFGIAKLAMARPGSAAAADATRAAAEHATVIGTTLGTVAYMSPEQARGDDLDARADIFSFGIVLYEMATGVLPFTGATPMATFEALLTRPLAPPSSVNRSLPAAFDRILAKALEKQPDLRYQTAADLGSDLKRLTRSGESATLPAAAAIPRPPRRVGWKTLAGGAAAAAAVLAGVFVYASRPRAFTERDTVVITDFANSTGEPVFDDALKEALEVQLRQSPFLSVLPEQRIQGTLRLMGRRADEKLTPDVARDLCQRTASKAMIAGAISRLGTAYVISLNASNCQTGNSIEKQQVQAATAETVLKALGTAAEQLRRGLGESLASIGKYDAPVTEATTASLEALKSYSVGMATRRRQGDAASLPFFKKAVEQDPEFALAHARLSTVLNNLGEGEQARQQITRAYALKDRVSEPERLYITARYYTIVEQSRQKAIETYQIWNQTYPNDFVPHSNLAVAYEGGGELDKAVEEFRAAIALAPDESLPRVSLAAVYVSQGKLDDARRTLADAIAHGVDSTSVRSRAYLIAFLAHDEAEMAKQLDAARRFPDAFGVLGSEASVAIYQGRLARAIELTERFESESIAKTGLKGAGAGAWSNVAQSAAAMGDVAATRAAVTRSLGLERNLSTLLNAAFSLAVIGDPSGAQRLADEARVLPLASTNDARTAFREVDAVIKLRRHDRTALDALPAPKDDNDTGLPFTIGVANLEFGNAAVAAEQFKRIADRVRPSLSVLSVEAPLYYGRALAKLGKVDESRKAYEKFLESWKNADAGLPLLVAAKKEYAALGH